MSQLKLIIIFFVLFDSIHFFEASTNTKRNTETFKYMMRFPGWQQFNDIKHITYLRFVYPVEEIFQDIKRENSNQKIRAATLLLGCSYSKDLQMFLYTLDKFYNHCINLMHKNEKLWWDCTTEYLNVLGGLKPLASMMIESILAMETMHIDPMKDSGTRTYKFFCAIHDSLQIPDVIQNNTISRGDISTSRSSLIEIKKHINTIIHHVSNNLVAYCQLKDYSMDATWELWQNQYDTLNSIKTTKFHTFLSMTLNYFIKMIIWNKYHRLGFQFDNVVQKVVVSVPPEYILHPSFHNDQQTGSKAELLRIKSIKEDWQKWYREIDTAELKNFLEKGFNNCVTLENNDTYDPDSVDCPNISREPELIDFFNLGKENESKMSDVPESSNNVDQGLNSPIIPEDVWDPNENDGNKTYRKFL